MRRFAIPGLVVTTTITVLVLAGTPTLVAQPAGAVSLPAAVRKAFEQSYPGAAISTATQTRDGNRTVFRVDSTDKGRRRVGLYDGSGNVVEVSEQVAEKDLPRPVADAMHSHPRAIYGSGWKVTRGGRVECRLTLRGTRRTAMVAKPDGTLVSFK